MNHETVAGAFVACPRCSFFLAGYRLIHDDFAEAVEKSQGNWLDLTWNSATRNLVQKSFGCRIDQDTFHFEGVCKECRRSFVYKASPTERSTEVFRIEVNHG